MPGLPRRVSVAVPVYNGEANISRTLDSVLSQTFDDFEIIVSDNASTDRTPLIVAEYVRRDPRVRYIRNDQNIGLIGNYNRLVDLSAGKYFRLLGCGDLLAPTYLERCVRSMDDHPDAVLVTTYQQHIDHAGRIFYKEYRGRRVDSLQAYRRFCRMLWFIHADLLYLDPLYGLIRSSVLKRSARSRRMFGTDLVLALELSLMGPFCHVPECLCYREATDPMPVAELMRRLDPTLTIPCWYRTRMYMTMAGLALEAPMTHWQKGICLAAVSAFYLKKQARLLRAAVALRSRCQRLWDLRRQDGAGFRKFKPAATTRGTDTVIHRSCRKAYGDT